MPFFVVPRGVIDVVFA